MFGSCKNVGSEAFGFGGWWGNSDPDPGDFWGVQSVLWG